MKASELREESAAQLGERLLALREEQFRLRMQKATGQLRQTHLLQENRRLIARTKSVLQVKNRQALENQANSDQVNSDVAGVG